MYFAQIFSNLHRKFDVTKKVVLHNSTAIGSTTYAIQEDGVVVLRILSTQNYTGATLYLNELAVLEAVTQVGNTGITFSNYAYVRKGDSVKVEVVGAPHTVNLSFTPYIQA